ncbi:MAG TPA: class I SAM-dependent methyltransferase [Pyrinomonadaceae bacterium]|nr:class I SAM-dependent methyltransferase [Pyrinomonadaceae bacterium]
MVTHISDRQSQYSYFNQQLEGVVWQGSKILDFGGNVGGFLISAGTHVDHDDYWCLDITRAAIEQGKRMFPRAHFVHYDRYSSYFNPNGGRHLPVPDLGLKFDIILAFSVFTHTHQSEMMDLVEQLRSMLAPQGVLGFTFCDPCYDWSLSDPELPEGTGVLVEMCEQQQVETVSAETADLSPLPGWCVAVDDELHFEPSVQLCQQERSGKADESYCSYFTTDYMASLFPTATILPPVRGEWQHCCILKNTNWVTAHS